MCFGVFEQARKEMITLLSGVIKSRRAEQASGASTVEKTDLLQVRSRTHMACSPHRIPTIWVMDAFGDSEGREGKDR